VVVTVPGLGDDIQAIKAGILEIADVLVVNKSDREGADRTVRDLFHMLELREQGGPKQVEIIKTVAAWGLREGSGIVELSNAIEQHKQEMSIGDVAVRAAERRAAAYLAELVRSLLAERADTALARLGGLAQLAQEVACRKRDPYSAAETIMSAL
jgi:LAO/AO transport system kinase